MPPQVLVSAWGRGLRSLLAVLAGTTWLVPLLPRATTGASPAFPAPGLAPEGCGLLRLLRSGCGGDEVAVSASARLHPNPARWRPGVLAVLAVCVCL